MAWLAVDKEGNELISHFRHERKLDTDYMVNSYWGWYDRRRDDWGILLPKGSIKKLTSRELTCEDEPVGLKEE